MFKALVDTIHAYQTAAHRAAGTTSGVTMHGTRFHEQALIEARAKQDALEAMIVNALTAATQRAEVAEAERGEGWKLLSLSQRNAEPLVAQRAALALEVETLRAERDALRTRAEAAEAERDALRTMLQMYNLGGYTDSVAIMTRALAAETERDALLKVYEAAEDFIGAQGTAYEDDQYRMLCGVVGAYNTTRGVHERRIG
jgi:hypothetical protein